MRYKLIKKTEYDGLKSQIAYWRKRSKFTLNVPYFKIGDVGNVQVFCEDEDEANKLIEYLIIEPIMEED